MSQLEIMEKNLAQLLNQHLSLPHLCQEEPSDPFQKTLFGKKMRNSKVYPREQHRSKDNNSTISGLPANDSLESSKVRCENQPESPFLEQDEDIYLNEMSSLFLMFRDKVNDLSTVYQERARQIKKTTSEEEYQETMQQIISDLEGTFQFIMQDFLKVEPREETYSIPNKGRPFIPDKQNVSHLSNQRRVKDSQRVKSGRKSVYEAVLEERELRRARKKMI